MKKVLLVVVAIGVILGVFYFINKKEAIAPVVATDQVEQINVENYLRSNISKLSPVPAVLGGTWYVTSFTIDLGKKSGTVEYEDGHIQETKDFSYITNEKREVVSLAIN
jgi:hypothetical protein